MYNILIFKQCFKTNTCYENRHLKNKCLHNLLLNKINSLLNHNFTLGTFKL